MNEEQESKIAEYLINNPGFFERQKNVLRQAKLSHDSGAAVSLVEKQVHLLRKEHRELQGKFIGILKEADQNQKRLSKVHQLLLLLLKEQDFHSFLHRMRHQLLRSFNICDVALLLNDALFTPIIFDGLYFDCHKKIHTHDWGMLDATDKLYCGAAQEEVCEVFFKHDPAVIESMAVLPLIQNQQRIGMLLLASENANTFQERDGTLFLELLASMLSCLLYYRFSKDQFV